MFSRMKQAMQARRALAQVQQQQAQRLTLALARQAQAASTVRQLALVDNLARCWLPLQLRKVVVQALQAKRVALPLPIPSPGFPKSTVCSVKTAKRSTSKRRRAK